MAATQELHLDSTDLKWLSERLDSLDEGAITVQSAVLAPSYLPITFRVKRVGADPTNDDDGRLVLVLRVPA